MNLGTQELRYSGTQNETLTDKLTIKHNYILNYLGHIFLSGKNEPLMVGNFIGDYVKGKQYQNYPVEIQKGILLHRAIDEYTDRNEHWMAIRELLKPIYKRYAGVVADISTDHFLAANWNQFSDEQLSWYAKWVYAVFLRNFDVMPKQVQGFLPYLIQHRRLQSYAKLKGFEMSLRIMTNRTSLPDGTNAVMQLLNDEYEVFNQHALHFLNDVFYFVKEK